MKPKRRFFESLIEQFFKGEWGNDIVFGIDEEASADPDEDLETMDKETFATSRDKVETEVTVYFNKRGFPVHTETTCKAVINLKDRHIENLTAKLKEAVESEDYAQASLLKAELEKLQKPK